MGGLCQFQRPPGILRIPVHPAHPVEGMHPFCQVVVVLPVLVPFKPLIERFPRHPFLLLLPDPETPDCRMQFTLLFTKTADPALPLVITSVPAEEMVNLVD